MAARGGGKKENSNAQPAKGAPARQSQFFVNGNGIDREVITTDICRYLGNDALVRPGSHKDPNTGKVQEGFYITAYRPPTTAQLQDLRADSLKWQREREREKNSAGARGGYPNSAARREIWGGDPDEPPAQVAGGYVDQQTQNYGQTPQTQPTQNPARGNEYMGRGTTYPPINMQAMAPPPPPGNYRAEGYASSGQQNYTTSYLPQQATVGYSVMDSSRVDNRMDTAPRNMPPGATYPPSSGIPQIPSGYGQGRGATGYYPGTAGPAAMPAPYHTDGQGNYPDPYGRADSGTPQDEPQQDYYTNDDELMDYEEQPAAPPPSGNQPPRRTERDRDRDRERERDRDHEAPRKHRHR